MEEKVNFTPGRSATNDQVIKELRFGFVGYLEKVLKRHNILTTTSNTRDRIVGSCQGPQVAEFFYR